MPDLLLEARPVEKISGPLVWDLDRKKGDKKKVATEQVDRGSGKKIKT